MSYTIPEAAEALKVSRVTVRRWIKSGRLKAQLQDTVNGPTWIIEDISPLVSEHSHNPDLDMPPLINRIEALSQEVGYWKARAMMLEERVRLLEAPRSTPRQSIWSRLFRR